MNKPSSATERLKLLLAQRKQSNESRRHEQTNRSNSVSSSEHNQDDQNNGIPTGTDQNLEHQSNPTIQLAKPSDNSIESSPDSSTINVNQPIQYNAEQQQAIDWAVQGYSFSLTGPAGSGKTTTVKGIIQALLDSGKVQIVSALSHKYLPSQGVPGIVVSAFTNKATENVKKNLTTDLQKNCVTIHKLLEFEPEYFTTEEGNTSMRFTPKRNRFYPQSSQITTLLLEESSMIPVDLWNQLIDSFPKDTHPNLQIIFIGDIQQLPPVFGKSIYIHAMASGIRTVELTHVYRQALESPIISLAHRVLSGKQLPPGELPDYSIDKMSSGQGKVFIRPWKKALSPEAALINMSRVFPALIDKGELDPETDVILTPYNVSFGQIEFNKMIAGHYAKKLNAEIWEIFTGINKKYLRVGDRVLWNKTEARITNIKTNPLYIGKIPRKPSNTMDYSGNESDRSKLGIDMTDEEADEYMNYIESMLAAKIDHTEDQESISRQASHIVTVRSEDTGLESDLKTSGELSHLDLAYAITVHKSQGSEYRRVFFITHRSQATMLYRELIYTAITRAKEELYIICEPNMFVKGINTQRYPGKTIREKIDAFNRSEALGGQANEDYIPRELDRFTG